MEAFIGSKQFGGKMEGKRKKEEESEIRDYKESEIGSRSLHLSFPWAGEGFPSIQVGCPVLPSLRQLDAGHNLLCAAREMKLRIKKWRAVAHWDWNIDDPCAICHSSFNGTCPDCKQPGDGCPPIWGQCNHVMHMHCILKWLASKVEKQCPLCRADWNFK